MEELLCKLFTKQQLLKNLLQESSVKKMFLKILGEFGPGLDNAAEYISAPISIYCGYYGALVGVAV